MKNFALFLVFVCLITSRLYSQEDFNFIGAGARQAGMGYAFIGIADDATALSCNPSGLSQLRKTEISLVARYTISKNEQSTATGTNNNTNKFNALSVNFVSVAYPVSIGDKRLVIGLSYQTQLDYTNIVKKETVFPTYTMDYKMDQNTRVNTISLGGAYNFLPWFSLGLALNKWFSLGGNETTYQYNGTFTPDNRKIKLEDNYDGVNFVVGALFNIEQINSKLPLKLGIKFFSPFDLKDDQKFTLNLTNLSIKGNTTQNRTFEYPSMIGAGASYKIGDFFTIACDYEIRQFKDKKQTNKTFNHYEYTGTSVTFIGDTTFKKNITQSNSNINQFRIGLEYILHPETLLIPIRVGFKTNPTQYANMKNNIPTDQCVGKSFNMGFGLVLKRCSFDIAYENYSYEQTSSLGTAKTTNKRTFNYFNFSTIYYFK